MIELKNIDLSFEDKDIFKGLNLNIERNDKVIFTGRSGVGKSSIFSMILGFIQPDTGKIIFNGIEIDETSVWDIRKKISYVDQDAVSGDGKVWDWIEMISGFNANSDADFTKNKILKTAENFDIESALFEKDISELSGGERQRMSILVSVLLDRDVFMLDEITSSLDDDLKSKTAEYFINREDVTVLAISHDPVWVQNDKVRIFDLGEMKWKL